MGLFSTLTASTGSSASNEGAIVEVTTPTSSATIATVVQLYSNQQIILMEDTPIVTGYSSLTYQAIQVGAASDDAVVAELKNRHSNPDLGVWNCRVVVSGNENCDPLVDSLLAKLVAPSEIVSPPSVYCLTVDLSDETTVEPNLSALQAALVRHLIEHPPKAAPDANSSNDTTKIQTTSLYDLQTVQFGLASDEKAAERAIDEAAKEVRVGIMICAVVSSNDNNTVDESSEAAYKKKQARALVIYHLRKFAASINSALCFVERPEAREQQESPKDPAADDGNNDAFGNSGGPENASSSDNNNTQLSVTYDKLSQLWRDMATGLAVWEQSQPETGAGDTTETADVSPTALYGPGRQQDDLIESLLLRNANYPGHWDASKDSLWVALPAAGEGANTTSTGTSTAGDDGWLMQLRDSIASALPPATDKADEKEKSATPAEDAGKPKEKDAAVSSFFESLLKNP
eukprot:CAMPEP_0197188876 /NCGR_PEP_ID=MMETSP1423-20130617/18675_1 /TAXON_ID=476441 /ORGANISM="Pseudo-nitzschia heimii, Strain UNC1101" /LENGTH=459 /DNA_ID=CAMNT_0042640849 /DNA_START=63 /DNA_END=1442 /DNA_ORIENTATION=+